MMACECVTFSQERILFVTAIQLSKSVVSTMVELPLSWLVKIVAYFSNQPLCLRLKQCSGFAD